MNITNIKLIILFIFFIWPFVSFSKELGTNSKLPIPRFVSLKSNLVNLRKGPNIMYPIVLEYKRKGYPLEVIAEFENWRKLKDNDGSIGWVHENLISGNRHVMIKDAFYLNKPKIATISNELILFRYPDETSYPMVRVEIGVLGKLKKCQIEWCQIKVEGISGWAFKKNLWGVYADEIIK